MSVQTLVIGSQPATPRPAPQPARRQPRLARWILLAILLVQAAFSLRVRNTAFEDEALYLYAGHLELAHWFHGAALQFGFTAYFSGAPVLYPAAAGFLDNVGGLALARALSLAEMLAVTALAYSIGRQLVNEKVGLYGAAVFGGIEATLFLGNFATYDATALCLLALAAWIVVRTARHRWPTYLLAAPVAALAVATKYAGGLYVPTIAALAALAAMPYRGRWALLRAPALGIAVAALLLGALRAGGHRYLVGIEFSTTNRAPGTTPLAHLVREALLWGGVPTALALFGMVAYARRAQTEPGERVAAAGGRLRRLSLGILLAGTALLAPLDQLHLHTDVSFQKHIGFGLFFAAPMAGIGLARIIGDHFRRVHLGVAVWAAILVMGIGQAYQDDNNWPVSRALVTELAEQARPGAHYLVEVPEVPIFYLLRNAAAQAGQFTSTYTIGYVNTRGQYLTGTAGFTAAVKAGYFRVIAYDFGVTASLDKVLARELEASHNYSLADVIPERSPDGKPLYHGNGLAYYFIWVRNRTPGPVRQSDHQPPAGSGHRTQPGRVAG